MPDCAFDIVLATCRIMGWDGAVERVVSASTGVEVEGVRGVVAVAATGGVGAETAGAETGGADDKVDAGVEVAGGRADAGVDEVAAVVGDGAATGGDGTAAGDGGVGRTEGD